jgi:hypothetical protein
MLTQEKARAADDGSQSGRREEDDRDESEHIEGW